MLRPLLADWRIRADALPERLLGAPGEAGFTLPGAQELAQFADLLGGDSPSETPAAQQSAPFPLPATIPDDVPGEVALAQEIDFGTLEAHHAELRIEQLTGRGRVLLGDALLAAFDSASDPCSALAVDLSDALRRGRRETIAIVFDETRPAGVRGAVMLHASLHARLAQATLTPDAAQQTMTASVRIAAETGGTYALLMQYAPPAPPQEPVPARRITLTLAEGESKSAQIAMSVPGESFHPGRPYHAGAIKLLLCHHPESRAAAPDSVLCPCDSMTLLCGYPGPAPRAHVPLLPAACAQPDIVERLTDMHIPGVLLASPAPEEFYRAMTRAGIGVIQECDPEDPLRARLAHMPCVAFAPAGQEAAPSLAASAWQLGGMTGYVRAVDPALTDGELLAEAAGRRLDPQDGGVRGTLAWLRAVLIRQRAEAARQGRYVGALCAPGEADQPDIEDAIRTALAPMHLSALPLCGAWWTGARFSASLTAFIPAGRTGFSALAVLEDGEGRELARLHAPCREGGGYIGVLEAALPDHPCVLEMTTRLLDHDKIIEESTTPVYVGERGPLEAAFH